jgi:SAM-dependent methyltransferase
MTHPHDELQRLRTNHSWTLELECIRENLYVGPDQVLPPGTFSEDQSDLLGQEDGGSSWWFYTRNQLISRMLSKFGNGECLWEIGSGAGAVGCHLIEQGLSCIGVEPYSNGATISASRGLPSIRSGLESLQLPSESLGQIGMFDVLEHVEHREPFLGEINRLLKPGGNLYLTVPALTMLWSEADVRNRHFLRYSRRTIVQELDRAGFTVVSVRYFFASLVVPLLLLRAVPYRLGVNVTRTDQRLLVLKGGFLGKMLCEAELLLSSFAPIGSSLIVVARKRA